MNMLCMYTLNSKIRGWWKEVTLLIWGASGDLLVKDHELKDKITEILCIEVLAHRLIDFMISAPSKVGQNFRHLRSPVLGLVDSL